MDRELMPEGHETAVVLVNFVTDKMISSGKTLTTRIDPSEGIRNAPAEIKFLDKPAGL